MGHLSDVTPFLSKITTARIFLYHTLYYLIIGPFTLFPVWFLSGKQFADNIGLSWGSALRGFTMLEYICYFMYIVPVAILCYEKKRYSNIQQDLYPMCFYIINIFFRIYIVSMRHGTTPPRIYRELYEGPLSEELINENLMLRAWAQISAKNVEKEVTKSMLKNEVCSDYFTFKVLLPIYPPIKKYFLDEKAYDNKVWNFNKFVAEERALNKEFIVILD